MKIVSVQKMWIILMRKTWSDLIILMSCNSFYKICNLKLSMTSNVGHFDAICLFDQFLNASDYFIF